MVPASLCLVAALLPAAAGYLWAWMYTLPQHPPGDATLGRSAQAPGSPEEVSGRWGCRRRRRRRSGDAVLCSAQSRAALGMLEEDEGGGAVQCTWSFPPPAQAPACSSGSPCAPGHFCDEHFGLCLRRRPEGQYCRHDAHCARGLLCMFGKCQQPAPQGQEGARCRGDSDCGAGACCARQHGERVCKRRLALAQGCHVPPGGLAFSLNQLCPCLEGLVCRPGEPGRGKAFEYRPEKSEWRCRQP
ncbi:dickkopf-related protein 1-like [Dromaius novaehollandiae]|uniref:dickkopf-related protein 1-like n=1 Tax=Dromaius novaehollandiae TaxID=8790 RepID=UPI0031204FDC